ncbi:GAF and ANTAR domain-containing protein [Cellulomonas shaoxiangyii]|uniref:ANTAR domain-containing protein n=1 Tax=Cellulomonas shaoxiangyii TaxID=2566013 RepID=A0A4P7SMA6_9CELL|nr:GAF and ANTAR domain-containing protein [Cellulomonas shaoxiangyii]QCB93713.1 ANTAR domain-containing protein [Cellulomonas shaoxiangyii]TGY80112.1 ANTAR domain-containing protein [Cellulomonas shaoxiangyii]
MTARGAAPGAVDLTAEPVAETMERLHGALVQATDVQSVVSAVAHASAALLAGDAGETSVTLRRGGRGAPATAVAWTGERSRRCDEVEYATGAGPCLSAVDEGVTILVQDVAREDRWPAWRDATLAEGFACSAAFPVRATSDVQVALNVYSERAGCWDDTSVALAEKLAADLGRVLEYSLRLVDLTTTTSDLQAALESRAVIDQAIGIVMAQNRCPADEAVQILRRASQARNVKLRDLAQDMVRHVGGAEPPASTFEPRHR